MTEMQRSGNQPNQDLQDMTLILLDVVVSYSSLGRPGLFASKALLKAFLFEYGEFSFI